MAFFIFLITFVGGALNLCAAVTELEKYDYFMFGLHIMAFILFAAIMIKSWFTSKGD